MLVMHAEPRCGRPLCAFETAAPELLASLFLSRTKTRLCSSSGYRFGAINKCQCSCTALCVASVASVGRVYSALCCDHIIHGTITCCVGVYHFLGFKPVMLAHLFVVPLAYFISDGLTQIQRRLAKGTNQHE